MREFTAVYVEGDEGCIVVLVEEFPEIVTQGSDIEDARQMALDARSGGALGLSTLP